MQNSMTGSGRGQAVLEEAGILTVELRSSNHGSLDPQLKVHGVPDTNSVHQLVRDKCFLAVSRGRIGVVVRFTPETVGAPAGYRAELARYLAVLAGHVGRIKLVSDVEPSEDEVLRGLEEALAAAVPQLLESRRVEGARLCEALEREIEALEGLGKVLAEAAPAIDAKERERLAKLAGPLDDAGGVQEEVVRLFSHLDAFKTTMRGPPGMGRTLGAIQSEIGREVNALRDKTRREAVAPSVLKMWQASERIRELVANLE